MITLAVFILALGDPAHAGPAFDAPHYAFTDLTDVVTGDFNGDGLIDVVAGEWLGNDIGFFRNLGGGTLATHVQFSVNVRPIAIVVTDINADGRDDIVAANRLSDDIALLFGLSDGTFAGPILRNVPAGPQDLFTIDLDGDGDDDVVVACEAGGALAVVETINGTLGQPSTLVVGGAPACITAGDVNGDGVIDLVMGDAAAARVALVDQSGRVTALFDTPAAPRSIAAADLDLDGRCDLAFTTEHELIVAWNDGAGAFSLDAIAPARAVELHDIDADGNLDLVAVGDDSPHAIIVMNSGARTFAPPASQFVGSLPRAVTADDITGDGALDLVAIVVQPEIARGNVTIVPGAGNGSFHSPPTTNHRDALRSPQIADTDGDGTGDLLAIDSNALVVVRRDDSGGLLAPATTPLGASPIAMTIASLGDDDHPDAVVATPAELIPLFGDGSGQFQPLDATPIAPTVTALTSIDLDGDGRDEIFAAVNDRVGGRVYAMVGVELIAVAELLLPGAINRILPADLDGDGDLDALAIERATGVVTSVLNINGELFVSESLFSATDIRDEEVGDLDGDGDIDLAILNEHRIAAHLNDGAGNLGEPFEHFFFDFPGTALELGDLDDDGDLDGAMLWGGHTHVLALENLGDALFRLDERIHYRGRGEQVELALTPGARADAFVIAQDGGVHLLRARHIACAHDLAGDDDVVGPGDLGALLEAWGECEGPCSADLNGDGRVSFSDLLELLAAWGPCR